ncbi:hypothetical protein [Streptomyces graminilatus]|uniref:hypothetical protein n=1 Tax=Streptomyces graminilatus TaxID=1464070 RepID=UPI0007C7DE98|nr:hypothetical protein [Streptomyces graminilatus]
MPKPAAHSAPVASFLLTIPQGHAARRLLSYTATLPLSSPDAQLLAVVITIRAARGGTARIGAAAVRELRLDDAYRAVADLRALGWQLPDRLLDLDADAPALVTVPPLAAGPDDHPLPLGKDPRSRVSGWTARTLTAPLLTGTPPAAQLAGLFLAGHASAHLNGTLPDDLPRACRDHLPGLVTSGFLTHLDDDLYRLGSSMRNLVGRLPHRADPDDSPPRKGPWKVPCPARTTRAEWAQWKQEARPTVRQNAEAVERCTVCRLPRAQVAAAFTATRYTSRAPRHVRDAYDAWKERNPGHSLQAAQATAVFRTRHGHGPSYGQLCSSLGWPRTLRSIIVERLLADRWLAEIPSVPWTLRPGETAAAHGILLQPRAARE